MSIETKLQYLEETKTQIKQAIIDKGVEVTDSDTFRSYANKISDITTGDILPKNIAGLVMCLDGEINSRSGVRDESIRGMQNLVYAPIVGSLFTSGFLDQLNGTPTFTDKGCTLGGTCFYPDYYNNEMTVEFCVEMTGNMEGYPLPQSFILHRVFYGGWQIWIGDPDTMEDTIHNSTVTFQAFNSTTTQTKNIAAKFTQTYGERIYYTVTTKFDESNSTKVYTNGELVTNFPRYEDGIATAGTDHVNVGIGGLCSTGSSSATPTSSNKFPNGAFYSPYLKWYMFRKWSRRLTPEEIKENYNKDKKRFG